jgi:hypothetical protein
MKYQTKTIVDAEDVSGAITSAEIDLRNNYGCAYQAKLSGAPSGDVVLQGTNDEPSASSREWTTIKTDTISGTTTIANNVDGLYWPYIRVYKAAGGTGTMTVTITIKGA